MTSRRELYAHGEPFGDSATRAKLGGGYVCGGGGDSSSSSSQTTNYNQYDQRSITDARQNNETTNTTTTINALDGGAIDASKSIALAGIANNATNTANLLAVADRLFTTQRQIVDANAQLSNSLAGATLQNTATAESTTAVNKTMIYAGLAVAGIVAVTMWKKK